jgi:protein-tyrosine-phosphatase
MSSGFSSDRNVPLETRIVREARSLADEFSGVFNFETVYRYIEESFEALGNVRLTEYVHIFAGRFARERLKALAQVEGRIAKDVPVILYLCNHNAGRSQMAAAFTAHLGGDRVGVMSAGSTPSAEVNTVAIQAMGELGIDMSREFPKPVTDEVVRAADVVITMGCGDACPVYPGKRYLDWDVDDPAGQRIEAVRPIRDDIRRRVESLLMEMSVLELPVGGDARNNSHSAGLG